MTVGAVALAVTGCAEPAVVGSHGTMALEPAGSVPRVVQPGRRTEHARRKAGLHQAAGAAQVTRRAAALGLAPGRRRHLVAAEAAPHAGKLVARRQLEVLDCTVALATADVVGRVRRVAETQVRRGDALPRHAVSVSVVVADVAVPALADQRAAVLPDSIEVAVIGVVAAVATGRGRQQAVLARAAGLRARVAARTGQVQLLDVLVVIETDRELLWWEDSRVRSAVSRGRTRRAIVQRDGFARRKRSQTVDRRRRSDRARTARSGRSNGQRVRPGRSRVTDPDARCQGERAREHQPPGRGLHRDTATSSVASARKRCPTSRFMLCSHSIPRRMRRSGEIPPPST